MELSRRLRDLCEPIAANVYFAQEAFAAYGELGLDYPSGYFCSRSACMGRLPGEVVAATFGVFNPEIVIRFVDAGWTKTDPQSVLDARYRGATASLRRILGDFDPSRAVSILRPVMESLDVAGRPIFSGLRSLPFPGEPVGQLWRVCDYVREHRGDGHTAAWIAAGCDPIEITVLTELWWGVEIGSYIRTRGWSDDQVEQAVERLTARGLVRDRAFTDEGRSFRREIERATDAMESPVVNALGDDAGELFAILEPWPRAIVEAGGYPVDPGRLSTQAARA